MMTNHTLLSDFELLAYNQQGLIPAPDETEETFCARAEQCLHLKVQLSNEQALQFPFASEAIYSNEILESAFPKTKALFDIQPSWLPVFFSNYQLAPWHGGCAWIFQLQADSPRTSFLQLRKTFAKHKIYLKLYQREELAAHEMAHVGRMMFNEERFEEILAYRTSTSSWRKWLGPLVQSSTESLLFMFLLFALLLLDSYMLLSQNFEGYVNLAWLKIFPAGLLFLALLRLWNRHRAFNQCQAQLQKTFSNASIADHVIYRLSDKEITTFSHLSSSEILDYCNHEKNKSLRWRLINLAYFTDKNHQLR